MSRNQKQHLKTGVTVCISLALKMSYFTTEGATGIFQNYYVKKSETFEHRLIGLSQR
tara:strand:+ start:219 stop:389 length:171 start_codon:yes stop_codon:yes gene_type:complete